MSVIRTLRDALAADLEPLGVPVHAAWPTELDVPCAFITPPLSDAYVTGGARFGEYVMSVDLVLIVDHNENPDAALASLEDLIEIALANTVDWALNGVESPAPINVVDSGAEYLGTVIHLSKPTRL